MNGRVEAGAEQRPDQELRFLPRHFARVGAGMDHRSDAVVASASRLHCAGIHSTRAPAPARSLPGVARCRGPNMLSTPSPHRATDARGLLSIKADCIGHDHHRIDFGAVLGHRVEAAFSRQCLRELFRGLREARPQGSRITVADNARSRTARARSCFGRIAFENEARRPPGLLALEVAQTHAAAGTEGRRIVQDLPDLGVGAAA